MNYLLKINSNYLKFNRMHIKLIKIHLLKATHFSKF